MLAGWESNPYYQRDNTRSLTCFTTGELLGTLTYICENRFYSEPSVTLTEKPEMNELKVIPLWRNKNHVGDDERSASEQHPERTVGQLLDS